MSNEQQMYRQHKRMRVGTFLTLALPAQRSRPVASGRVVWDVQRQCPGTGAPAGLPQRSRRSLRRSCSCISQRDRLRRKICTWTLPHEIFPRTATGNKSILYCQIT